MPRPASNRGWCDRWDELSTLLLEELEKPDCNVSRVTELVRERRRLTTADPVNGPGEVLVSEEEQRVWLERSLRREDRVAALAEQVKERVGRSLASLKAGRAVRDRFDRNEAAPRVFSTRM
jgi:hypothetical protein